MEKYSKCLFILIVYYFLLVITTKLISNREQIHFWIKKVPKKIIKFFIFFEKNNMYNLKLLVVLIMQIFIHHYFDKNILNSLLYIGAEIICVNLYLLFYNVVSKKINKVLRILSYAIFIIIFLHTSFWSTKYFYVKETGKEPNYTIAVDNGFNLLEKGYKLKQLPIFDDNYKLNEKIQYLCIKNRDNIKVTLEIKTGLYYNQAGDMAFILRQKGYQIKEEPKSGEIPTDPFGEQFGYSGYVVQFPIEIKPQQKIIIPFRGKSYVIHGITLNKKDYPIYYFVYANTKGEIE